MIARADTWREVADYARSFVGATVSRLHNLAPREHARRKASDAAMMQKLVGLFAVPDTHDDAVRLFPEYAEEVGGFEDMGDGIATRTTVGDDITERQEVTLRSLISQFRADANSALGRKTLVDVSVRTIEA